MNSAGNQKDSSCRAEKVSSKIPAAAVNRLLHLQIRGVPASQRCVPVIFITKGFTASFKCCVAALHLNVTLLPSSTPPLLFLSAQQLWLNFCKNIPPPALESEIVPQTHTQTQHTGSNYSICNEEADSFPTPPPCLFAWGLAVATRICPLISAWKSIREAGVICRTERKAKEEEHKRLNCHGIQPKYHDTHLKG